MALLAVFLSVCSMLIHYVRRAENPILAPIEASLQSLQLAQADLVDRVDHWTRRDRTRRMREGANEVADLTPVDPKQALRVRAKQMLGRAT